MDKYNTNGEYVKELFTDKYVIPVPDINVIKISLSNIFLLLKTNDTISIDQIKQFDHVYDYIKLSNSEATAELSDQYKNMKINLMNKYTQYFSEVGKNNSLPSFVMIDFISQSKIFIKPEYKELYEELLQTFNTPTATPNNIKESFTDTTDIEIIKTNLNKFFLLLKNNQNVDLAKVVEFNDYYNQLKIKETNMDSTLYKKYVDTQVYLSKKYEPAFLEAVDTNTIPSSVLIESVKLNEPFIKPEYKKMYDELLQIFNSPKNIFDTEFIIIISIILLIVAFIIFIFVKNNN